MKTCEEKLEELQKDSKCCTSRFLKKDLDRVQSRYGNQKAEVSTTLLESATLQPAQFSLGGNAGNDERRTKRRVPRGLVWMRRPRVVAHVEFR